MVGNTLSDNFVKTVVAMQLREGDVTFANGTQANNHLDLGYTETHASLRTPIITALGSMIAGANFKPDYLVPVPTGAVGWVEAYADSQPDKSPILYLDKVQGQKREFMLNARNTVASELINSNAHGFVIDDATSDGGTSEAAADFLTTKGFKINGILSLFTRGNSPVLPSKYPRYTLMYKHIPANLNWNIFKQQGKIEQLTTK